MVMMMMMMIIIIIIIIIIIGTSLSSWQLMACIISATDYVMFVKGYSVSYCGSDGELAVQTVATEGNRKILSLN